jgi:hypothetical protein
VCTPAGISLPLLLLVLPAKENLVLEDKDRRAITLMHPYKRWRSSLGRIYKSFANLNLVRTYQKY